MKYCTHCGSELVDEAVVCVHCGRSVQAAALSVAKKDDTMETVVKIMMILGCVSMGWMIIPLAWCIPMTVTTFRHYKNGEPLSTGFKICTLLFVSVIAGICMLCMNDQNT